MQIKLNDRWYHSMKRSITCLAVAIAMWTNPALADKGWIATLGGAYVVPEEADLDSSTNPTSIDFGSGYGVYGALGYDFDFAQAELEASYRAFDIDSITETPSGGTVTQTTNGDVAITGLFLNAFYDVDIIDQIKPYVGAGIGIANIDVSDARIPGRTGTVDDSDIAPGGQIMVGLAVPVSNGIDVAAGYRFLYLGDVTGSVSGGSSAGEKDVTNILIHNFELALRYRF